MTRVLVIDDDPAQRTLFLQLLKRTGFDVMGADGGQEALEMLAHDHTVDVILTDVRMPYMSGVDFCRQVCKHYPHIPVVMMSVLGKSELERETGKRNNCNFLQKPFDRQQLVETLTGALQARCS